MRRLPETGREKAHGRRNQPPYGVRWRSVDQLKKAALWADLESLDAPVKGMEEDGVTACDRIASPGDLEADVLDRMQREQLCAVLWECVDRLPGRQPEVIRKRYQEGRTREAIGGDYGVSGEVIRQTESKALRELRKPRNSNRLRPFLEDERIYSAGLIGNGAGRFHRTWTSSTERAALELIDRGRFEKHEQWLKKLRGRV